MSDCFETVNRNVRVKIAVGDCRFLASVARTDSEVAAREFIAAVSGEFADATHNVYAFKIGTGERALCRQNDAGEPAGSAGPPLLQAIEAAGLTNVTVVATRYFGGVKLGIGGLVRAYRACAEAGLSEAGRLREVALSRLSVTVSYELLGTVLRELSAAGGIVDSVDYLDNGAAVATRLPLAGMTEAVKRLTDATRGKVICRLGNTT